MIFSVPFLFIYGYSEKQYLDILFSLDFFVSKHLYTIINEDVEEEENEKEREDTATNTADFGFSVNAKAGNSRKVVEVPDEFFDWKHLYVIILSDKMPKIHHI